MAAATKKHPPAPAPVPSGGDQPAVMDPKFELAEKAGSYVLRVALPGLTKDDFRVQVNGTGRLTVRGSGTAAAGKRSLHMAFQLPSAAILDDIAGRFEAGVLTLTTQKRGSSAGAGANAGVAAAPTSIDEIKRKQQPGVAEEEDSTGGEKKGDARAKKTQAKEEITREDASKKAMEEATNKAQEKKLQEENEAKSRGQEQQKRSLSPAVEKEEDVKPKSPQVAATKTHEEPAPKLEGATADKAKAAIDPESLAERVRRRGEEERAKDAAMTEKAERERKAAAACGCWKERVAGELKVLTDMKWADGLLETARNNKEVVAVGVAAFSLGFLVSHKLFRK